MPSCDAMVQGHGIAAAEASEPTEQVLSPRDATVVGSLAFAVAPVSAHSAACKADVRLVPC
jgi:hypothetical protein